jgi:hypothetical protein
VPKRHVSTAIIGIKPESFPVGLFWQSVLLADQRWNQISQEALVKIGRSSVGLQVEPGGGSAARAALVGIAVAAPTTWSQSPDS